MLKLSRNGKILTIGLVVALVLALLVTPLGGLETRSTATVTTLGFIGVISLLTGLVLNVASIVLLFSKGRARTASVLAIIGSILFLPVLFAKQTGNFSSLPAPPGIAGLELAMDVPVIAVLLLASRVYMESKPKPAVQ